jgi:hypothetical protein
VPAVLRRVPFDLVVPALVGAAVVAFASGSSSVPRIKDPGLSARWIVLLALLAAAAGWVLVRETLPSLRRSVVVAGACFVGLAVESAIWSVAPRISIERAGTIVLLFAVAVLLALATGGDRSAAERVLAGLVGGAVVVVLLGLVVLAFDHGAAVESATLDLPARYRGYGENPNTVSLLLAVCLPIAVWFAFRARSGPRRALAVVVALAFDASIVASGSRGGLVAGFCGVLVVTALAPLPPRRRLVWAAVTVAVIVASFLVALAPKSKGEASAPPAAPAPRAQGSRPAPKPQASTTAPKPRYINVQAVYPLEFEIGTMLPGEPNPTSRTLFGLTGRGEAWRGALDLANVRPGLGYGFGTEDRVFVDRYANFAGGLPENSYIGVYLQLGAIGVAAFLALAGSLALGSLRSGLRGLGAVGLGVLAAALVLAVVQSYIYSVGNIGTLAVWVPPFLAGAVVVRERAAA